MNVTYDYFGRMNTPSILLCNMNGEELGILDNALDIDVSLNFNTLSEISMRVPKNNPYYSYINMLRLIKVENLGQFIITQCPEINNGISKHKEIRAVSLERELVNKNTGQIKGTIKFYDPNPINVPDTLLGMLIGRLNGLWSIGHVDVDLMNIYRTFDIIDLSLYNFMMTEVEQTYGCVFKFDTFNRVINVYTPENAVVNTDIYLSFSNLVKSVNIEPQEEQLCTALEVIGGGDLDIRQVNPLGTNFIYDFSFFITKGFMSANLAGKVTIWQSKVDSYRTQYSNKLLELKALQVELLSLNVQLKEYQSDLAALKQKYQIVVDTSADPEELRRLNGLVNDKQSQINNQETLIENKKIQVTSKKNELKTINQIVSFESNFTSEELKELSLYIKEQSFQEPNIIKTSELTDEQIMNNALELFEAGKKVLSKLSKPRYTFNIDLVNFLAIPEFMQFTSQLQLGSRILLDIDNGFDIFLKVEYKIKDLFDIKLKDLFDKKLKEMFYEKQTYIEPILLQIQFSYTDPNKLNFVFGDRLRLPNEELDFEELMGQTVNTTTNVNGNSVNWGDWINSGAQTTITNFVKEPLNAAKEGLISSDNQQITMGAFGLQGKQLDPTTQKYLPTQVWLTSNQLCFTDDAWDSVKTAIGRIKLPNGQWGYGLAAEYLIGNIIFGSQMAIQNEGGTIKLDASGLTMTGNFNVSTPDIVLNPSGMSVTGADGSASMNSSDIFNFNSNRNGGKMALSPNGLEMIEVSGLNRAIVSPTIGFALQKWNGSGWDNKMWLDTLGNANFTGNINGSNITGSKLTVGDATNNFSIQNNIDNPLTLQRSNTVLFEMLYSITNPNGASSFIWYYPQDREQRLRISQEAWSNYPNASMIAANNLVLTGRAQGASYRPREFQIRDYDLIVLGGQGGARIALENDTHIAGTLTAVDKRATVKTEHYGWRQLYCDESDIPTFATKGVAKTINKNKANKYIVRLEESFFETIEPNSVNPYYITFNSYSKSRIWINGIYDKYIIFESEEPTNFSYEIRNIRKGYLNQKLPEVGNIFRKNSMDEFTLRNKGENI